MAGALLLQGCSNYKTTLQYPSGQSARTANVVVAPGGDPRFVLPQGLTLDEKAVLVLPRPAQDETVVSGDPKISDPSGWVQLRFNVGDQGVVSDLTVVGSSNPTLEFAARQLLASWRFEPATVNGTAVPFHDMEIVMGFSETTTAGEVIGTGVLVVVLLPLALLALAIGGMAGTARMIKSH